MHGSDEAIRLAREINPRVRVLARAGYLKEIPALRRAGADVVFSGEGEVALTMTEFLLRQLGATEEQIDRQRERIRDELFGTPLTMELLLPLPGQNRRLGTGIRRLGSSELTSDWGPELVGRRPPACPTLQRGRPPLLLFYG